MKEKFSELDWKWAKNCQPISDRYIYVFHEDHPEVRVYVINSSSLDLDEYDYWCYVFIPDAPQIEKKTSIEERLDKLEIFIRKCIVDFTNME